MIRVNTYQRREIYLRSGRPLTPRQRRRLVKKAGTDPTAMVARDEGMGFPPEMQGLRELIGATPVSGIPAPGI